MEVIMTIDERKSNGLNQNVSTVQNIILENREKLSISGVHDVLSFDDQIVILETELGLLTVKGENLRINKLSLDTTEVIVDGEIYNLGYSEKETGKKSEGGIFSKIFREEAINLDINQLRIFLYFLITRIYYWNIIRLF